jgi:hypothetical protein
MLRGPKNRPFSRFLLCPAGPYNAALFRACLNMKHDPIPDLTNTEIALEAAHSG